MLVVSVLLVAALSKRDVAGMTNMAELKELRAEDLVFTWISGVNHLCLFKSFAHGTRLDPVDLRRRVCAFMLADPTSQVRRRCAANRFQIATAPGDGASGDHGGACGTKQH
jgi:hypothetical protein